MLGRAATVLALTVFASGCNLKPGSSKEDVATAKMEEFVSQEGKFKAKFPGKPETNRQTFDVQTRGKSLQLKLTTFATMTGDTGYAVAVAEIPLSGDLDPIETNILLEKGRDKALEDTGASLESSKSILLQGRYQGKEIIAKAKDAQLKARIYLVGKRLYQVIATGTGTFPTEARATEFFDSFSVFE